MGLVELFVASLIVGISLVNSAVPWAAWGRSRDGRFALLGLANALLAAVGAVWVWGQLPVGPPSYAASQLPVLGLVLLASLALLATTIWRPSR